MGNVLNNKTFQNVTSEAGSAAVTVGNIYAYYRAITTTVVFLIFLIVGIILITKHGINYVETTGTVHKKEGQDKIQCLPTKQKTSRTDKDEHVTTTTEKELYDCKFDVEFETKEGKTIKGNGTNPFSRYPLNDNETVKIFYNKDNPHQFNVAYKPVNIWHVFGILALVIAGILFFTSIGLWANVIIVSHSKVIAGAEGVGVGMGVIGGTAENIGNMMSYY